MTGKIKATALSLQEVALCLVRKWWRPMTYIILGMASLVNGVVIPLWKMTPIPLTELAALVAAWSPVVAIREWGKSRGVETDSA
jgi:hypothetical protein